MASLISWAKNKVQQVEHGAQRAVAQVNPLDNGRTWQNPQGNAPQQSGPAPSAFQQAAHSTPGRFITPAVNLGSQLGQAAYHVATLPVEVGRTFNAELHNNAAATNAGVQRGMQGVNAIKGLGQGITSSLYQLGESVNPYGGDVYNRQHTFKNPVAKAVFGASSIPSMQKQYKDTKTTSGGAQAAGQAATTALMDALGVKAAAAKVPVRAGQVAAAVKKVPVGMDTAEISALKAQKQASINAMDTAKPSMIQQHVANVNNIDQQIRAIQQRGGAKAGDILPNRAFPKSNESAASANVPELPLRGIKPENPPSIPKVSDQIKEPQIPLQEKPLKGSTSANNNTTQQYLKDLGKQQESARGPVEAISKLKSEAKAKLIDRFAPIEDTLNGAIKDGAKITPSNDIKPQIDRALRAETIGGQYVQDKGLAHIIQNVPDTNAFDQYVIAKHAQDLKAKGIKTGRDSSKDQQLINDLAPTYEHHAQALTNYSQGLLDTATNYGLISKELASNLKQEYPNYVPFNRIFGEGEITPYKGNGGGKASLSTQTVVQKIKGSDRQIESPLASLIKKTQDVVAQGERNKAASILASYKDLPGNPFGITPLRTAADVKARIDLYSQAKELKPVQTKLTQLLKSKSYWAGKLENELNALNKKGLDLSLSKKADTAEAPILSGKTDVLHGTKRVTNPLRNIPTLTGTVKTQQFTRSMTAAETKRMVNSLVNKTPSELDAIKAKIATRENKLGPVLDQIKDMQTTLEGVKNNRQVMIDEARLHADAEARGKSTISVFNDGIKEVYETSPEIAAAAKNLNGVQLGLLGKLFSYPTRALRLGATGLNPAFALANVAKDTASAFINSKHPIQASIANPHVFVDALKAAFSHGSDQYKELVRQGAGGTSFDIARDAPIQNVKSIRAQKNAGTKAMYTVTHPGQLFRAAENAIGRSEEFNRAVQFYGHKRAFIKEGYSEKEATTLAANDARNNTVNFARGGEWTQVLNSTLPYLNAGIQGSRTLLRNLKDRPLETGAKLAVVGFMPVAVTTAWNLSSPDRKAAYDDISDYEKQGNIIIVPPGAHKDADGRWNVIKIPVSQEIANLNNIVRNGVEAAMKDKNVDAPQMAGNLVGSVTSLNTGSGRQLLGQVTPQAIKPFIESTVNQNLYTGNKIVPDKLKNLDAKDQYGDYTSGTAKVLGRNTGLSPMVIDNTARTAFGGLSQNVIRGTDLALAKTGVIKPNEVKGKSVGTAVADRFTSAQGQSPYQLAADKQVALTKQLKNLPGYQSMSVDDKAKALNRLSNDVSKTFSPPKPGQPQTKLSLREQGLAAGKPDLKSYLAAQKSGGAGVTVNNQISPHSQKVLNEYNGLDKKTRDAKIANEKDYEYKVTQAKYENDKANGNISSVQDIKKSSEINKAKVGSSYTKDVRDLYGLTKAQIYQYVSTNKNGQALADQLKAYDQNLYDSGINSTLKFKNGIAPTAKTARSTGGRSTGRKTAGRKVSSTKYASAMTKTPKLKTFNATKFKVAGIKPQKLKLPKTQTARLPKVPTVKIKTA